MKAYKLKDVSTMLDISYQKLLQMVKSEEIKSFKVGNDYRISEDAIKAFMAGE